jgi:DNA-binding transcriptional MerR regulator
VALQTEVLLRVSAVAKQADVPARTVRFYADAGLLRPIARGENGYRYFGEDAVERVHLLRRASRLGLQLKEIKDVMDIAQASDCADAHRAFAEALRTRIAAVEQQIRELSSMRTQLVDLAVESDAGCTDALCLCRTRPTSLAAKRAGR